ncbi:MAG TPA: SRPBCC domain-containing protein [Kofleriaceae bacterium]|nr:SRPBCC domain-containing protein [Kofleriaceae bacterium]
MSDPSAATPLAGDVARVSVQVAVDPAAAFRIFTEEIDQWWRQGIRFRAAGKRTSILCLEAGVGGRLFESFETGKGSRIIETGRVTTWDPPSRLVFEWRGVNFAPDEKTEVEVLFQPSSTGTLVTVTHRGWSHLRPDHPARHGQPVPAFIRSMGMWWGDLMTTLREHAASAADHGDP